MPRKIVVAAALLLLATAATARAAEGSLRFEKVVPFEQGKLIALGAQVGPVHVNQVQFGLESGGGTAGMIASIKERAHGGDPETMSMLKVSFDSENPKDQEWEVSYKVDFLDADDKLIDRASTKESFEGEASVVKIERPILTYVVPLIAKVRIRLEAALD
jgi:hypothetical protein